ncbi:MAG: hypothetical protein FJ291_18560 [Planctomycetes bacterium]|nr:hypothetical protein [Planctomycetota bacterium]
MTRHWLGVALLATSWLLGLSYYHQANWLAWAITLVVGTGLFVVRASARDVGNGLKAALQTPGAGLKAALQTPGAGLKAALRTPARRTAAVALALLLPAVWLAPWPYRAALLLLALGLLQDALPVRSAGFSPHRTNGLRAALQTAGAVLLGQCLALAAYAGLTARSHELPWPLPHLLGGIARLLGMEAAVDGSRVAIWSMRQVNSLGATWGLLVDPASLAFVVGGAVLLALEAWRRRLGLLALWRPVGALCLAVLAWLPIRAGLLMAFYSHRLLRTDYEAPLDLMTQFWSPWVHLLLLLPPVALAWRFASDCGVPTADCGPESRIENRKSKIAPAALAGLAVAALCAWAWWDPPGRRKEGRVLVDEHHSTWEPTQRPFDTAWYGHDSGYNYACIYDYCSRFYDMGRLTTPIDDAALDGCGVLIVKVPTSRYDPGEVAAIRRFVERGGGLMLVGEHTDVFGTGRHINGVARAFGFEFRYDCLFGVDSVFDDLYLKPLVPHPIVQHLPPFDFAVSASIAPGLSRGRAVILGTGLKSLPADYHASNFYPQVQDRPDMRYGAFVQLWATTRGRGRVVAFADSTVFSNFSAFEPGKAELMLGMIEWLNRAGGFGYLRGLLLALGLALLALAFRLARGWDDAWVVLLAAGTLGWASAAVGVRAAHRAAMPMPAALRPMTRVVIDRTASDALLSKSGFIGGKPEGFGIFERWVLRLGYFTARRSGPEAFGGDLLVFLHPSRAVPADFLAGLVRYVEEGGRVLVVDSPENEKSTANSLLWPFELEVKRQTKHQGVLAGPEGWPAPQVHSACEVEGGKPLITLDGKPAAATASYGRGRVVALGFGSRFSDAQMGVTGDVVPDPELRKVFDLEFALLRAIVEDRLRE